MAVSKEDTRSFAAAPSQVFDAVNAMAADPAQKLALKSADPATGVIELKSNVSMASYGENVVVRISPEGSGSSVLVKSSLKWGLVDWGKNRKNVEKIFGSIDAILRGGPATLGQ